MNDPFLRILKINRKGNLDLNKYTNETSLISFFDSHPIPQFSQKELNVIENSLKNGEDHSKSMKQFKNKLIPFVIEPIKATYKLINSNDSTSIEYINLYTLYLYIAWLISYENSHYINGLENLLHLIINLHDSEFQEIAKDCFLYAYNLYLRQNTFDIFPEYMKVLVTFFLKFKFFCFFIIIFQFKDV